jgi:xanthine dehydrogenase accessory factor
MRQIAETALAALRAGRDPIVGRVAEFHGFGGRRAGDALLIDPGAPSGLEWVGSLLMGAADDELRHAADDLRADDRGSGRLVTVPVGDREAVEAGMACGGSAEVLLQRASSIRTAVWGAICDRTPVGLVTVLDGSEVAASLGVDRMGVDQMTDVGHLDAALTAAVSAAVSAARRVLDRGGSPLQLHETDGRRTVVEVFVPDPTMLVLGASELADAIAAQSALIGANTTIVDERAGSADVQRAIASAAAAGPVDAVVVLSHDIAASCDVLAAALRGRCGYVGALGSRHTQSARAADLRDRVGLEDPTIARIRGPVGLDLGSRTPAETALAIAAEWLAVRSSRSASSLADSSGPING